MKWASIGKWLGLIVAAIPQIIQAIGIFKGTGPPLDPNGANATSGIGLSAYLAGLGKEQSDNTKRIQLGLASEPNPIPVHEQDAAIKAMK